MWESEIARYADLIEPYSLKERYWASYIAAGELTCSSIETLSTEAVDEAWTPSMTKRRLGSMIVDLWEFIAENFPGFGDIDLVEMNEIIGAGTHIAGCFEITDALYTYIGDE